MFERNKVDNSQELTAVAVELTLDGDRQVRGKLWIPRSRSLTDVLNGAIQFIEFETFEGGRSLIAKASLKAISLMAVPNAQGLAGRLRDDTFDPYAILGVAKGTAWDEVRQAYHTRSKAYHPDRYATADLPGEVGDYLATMARRINAAYAALDSEQRATTAKAKRAEPVYSSAARG